MSNSVHDVLGAIQTASEALTLQPQLQERITILERTVAQREAHNSGLEQNILGYKAQIDNLTSQVATLTGERDEAMFRNLELGEKLDGVVQMLAGLNGTVSSKLNDLAPPKPEPLPAPVVEQPSPVASGWSETNSVKEEHVPFTPATGADPQPTMETSSTTSTEPRSIPITESGSTRSGPYVGKSYFGSDVPSMGYDTWIAGGGNAYGWNNNSARSDWDPSKA